MDENWPLFAARIAGRSPTDNEARLLDASHRLWISALAFTRSKLSQSPAPQSDAKSLTTEIWEETLSSVLRTMEKLGDAKISDLDSYLFAIFINRLNRYLARERKRQQIIELVPSTEDLAELKGAQDSSSAERIESEVLLREALDRSDEFFRTSAWYRCQGYPNNLFLRKSALLHDRFSSPFYIPGELSFQLVQFSGAGHVDTSGTRNLW